jgi:hypothetical protein
VPVVAPLEVLAKTHGFGKFDMSIEFGGKHCKKRKFPCASDGKTCLACGRPCPPKTCVPKNFFDRRVHFIVYGVLK